MCKTVYQLAPVKIYQFYNKAIPISTNAYVPQPHIKVCTVEDQVQFIGGLIH